MLHSCFRSYLRIKMYIFITLAVLPLVANTVSCESTNEPPKDIQVKTTLKTAQNDASTSADPSITSKYTRSLWVNQPVSHQPKGLGENNPRYKMLLRTPHSLTKLAKTLALGFDPSFSKDYFEPFERRPRPVTLVAFRKNGFASRRVVHYAESKSSEIAELQSPYNEVSNFWQNEDIANSNL